VSTEPAAGDSTPDAGEVRLGLDVYGMRCQSCATNLRLGLGEVDGVRGVDVELRGNRVAVIGQADLLQEAAMRAKVAGLGYRLMAKASLFQRLKSTRASRE
jgi:copper chaperone CopZ